MYRVHVLFLPSIDLSACLLNPSYLVLSYLLPTDHSNPIYPIWYTRHCDEISFSSLSVSGIPIPMDNNPNSWIPKNMLKSKTEFQGTEVRTCSASLWLLL